MDQQGKPIGGTRDGTKVTSEPAPPIHEGPGPIASDSLAADSVRQGGAFSENPDPAPAAVKGASSTFANEDTSGAKELRPAPDAEARESQDAWNESSKLKGASGLKSLEGAVGQPDFSGVHDSQGYWGGPSSAKHENAHGEYASGLSRSASGHTDGEQYRAARAKADPAPISAGDMTGDNLPQEHTKLQARNIKQGGFDFDDAENASFAAEMGSEKDSGRVAEQRLQRENAQAGQDAGAGSRQKGIEKGGVGYESLRTDEEA